jgi:hypothetical protein
MAEKAPAAEQPYLAKDTDPTPWVEARDRLADADTYWLATVRPDGLPHLVPLLAVWVDGALHFVASRTLRTTHTASSRPGGRLWIWWSKARPRRLGKKPGSIAWPRCS